MHTAIIKKIYLNPIISIKGSISYSIKKIKRFLYATMLLELCALPMLFALAIICRYKKKAIDIGIGPESINNNINQAQALKKFGYTSETFVLSSSFITNKFDIDTSKFKINLAVLRVFYLYYLSISRYKILYIYFSGGPLAYTKFLCNFEPLLLKIAQTKVIVMPYGGDVQDLRLCKNLQFINAISNDYPHFQKSNIKRIKNNMDRWVKRADHIISGCDWVEYMYHWDTLMLAHFVIDTELWTPNKQNKKITSLDNPFKILHCPNHVNIKGTKHFEKAIKELQLEGYNVELIFIQNVSNSKIMELMHEVDAVADQLIIGWYAMTALEAMCLEKPVLCYIKPSLLELYEQNGLLMPNELPVVNCNYKTVKQQIKFLIDNPVKCLNIGKRGREFAIKHHSLLTIGKLLHNINSKLGIRASQVIEITE